MPEPSNGITPKIIRGGRPPYQLSADLLAATIAAIPPPPPDASEAWHHARSTRLIQEFAAYHPADAAQARLVSQLLIVGEAAGAFTARAYAPGLTLEQQCQLRRCAAEQLRAAAALARTLERHQQRPVPFYGTVVLDEVDIAALVAIWGTAPPPPAATTNPAAPPAPRPARPTPNPIEPIATATRKPRDPPHP